MGLIDLSAYLWPEDVTGRLPRLGRRFDPTHRLNSNTWYTLYGGELYGPNDQGLAVPPLEAGLTVGLGTGGIGLANSGASANGLDYGLPGRYLTATGSVLHITATATLTGDSTICAVWEDASEKYQHLFAVNADGTVTFGIYQESGLAYIQATPAGTVPMGRATTISAYWQAGVGILIAVDGKLCTSYSNVWVQGSPSHVAWAGQCWGGKLKIFAGASGTLHYLKIQGDVRTAKDLIEISRNPNELFEPLPDLPFSLSAAGGGGTQTLTPPLHTNSQSFYSPTVSQSSAPQSLTATLFTSNSTIFVPTVQASKALSAGLFSNANTLYSLTVTATKTLAVSFYSNAQAFYPPAVSVGSVSITPSLYSNAQAFYAHVLNQVGGPQNVVVPLFNNTQTFYSPLLSPGAVSVTPSLYANAPTFYGLTVTTSKTLTASLFSNASELYEPLVTLAGGPQIIAPSLFSNTASFFTHMVASGLVQLYPVRFDSPSVFYAPVVSTGSFSGSISDEDITRIVQAVLAALNATTIPVDTRRMNGAPIIGTGLVGDDWRGFGVQPQ